MLQDRTHTSELPLRYWANLFDFFGYGALLFKQHDGQIVDRRLIFYRRSTEGGKAGPEYLSPARLGKFTEAYRIEGTVFDSLVFA